MHATSPGSESELGARQAAAYDQGGTEKAWKTMRLRTLELQNFRCFDRLELDLAPGFNIFVGDNASGKTALLDALQVAIGSFFLGVDGESSRGIRRDEVRQLRFAINGDVSFERVYPVRVLASGEVGEESLQWWRRLNGEGRRTTRRGAGGIAMLGRRLVREVRQGRHVVLPLVASYGTGRLWQIRRDHSGPAAPGSRLDAYRGCLNARTDQHDLFRWWKRQEFIGVQSEGPTPALRGVKQAVCAAIPGAALVRFDMAEGCVVVSFDDGTASPFPQLSDGYRNVLAIVADLARRAATLNPHLGESAAAETPGVVLIDELGLHLHPRWQREIVETLRNIFPEVQFIATTHAPQILVGTRSAEVRVLRRDPGAPSVRLDVLDIPPGLDVDRVLTGAWFDLPSTLDPETIELLERHARLAATDLGSADEQALAQLLRRRLGSYDDLSLEGIVRGIAQELLAEVSSSSAEERRVLRDRVAARVRERLAERR